MSITFTPHISARKIAILCDADRTFMKPFRRCFTVDELDTGYKEGNYDKQRPKKVQTGLVFEERSREARRYGG